MVRFGASISTAAHENHSCFIYVWLINRRLPLIRQRLTRRGLSREQGTTVESTGWTRVVCFRLGTLRLHLVHDTKLETELPTK